MSKSCQNWHLSDSICFPRERRLVPTCPEWLLTGVHWSYVDTWASGWTPRTHSHRTWGSSACLLCSHQRAPWIGVTNSKYVTLEEQLAFCFYHSVTGLTVRHVGEIFQRSNDTITWWALQINFTDKLPFNSTLSSYFKKMIFIFSSPPFCTNDVKLPDDSVPFEIQWIHNSFPISKMHWVLLMGAISNLHLQHILVKYIITERGLYFKIAYLVYFPLYFAMPSLPT